MSDSVSHSPHEAADEQGDIQPKRTRFLKLKIGLGIVPEPSGRPSYIWLERKDALIVALVVAIGVPVLGYSNFSLFTKVIIAAIWFAIWAPFFFYFEARELIGQMHGRGSIDPEQVSEQQNTAQNPYWGVIAAIIVWLVVLAVHVALQTPANASVWELVSGLAVIGYRGLWTTPIQYGYVEWALLLQTWMVTKYTNYVTYNVGNTLLKATPMAERTERRMPH